MTPDQTTNLQLGPTDDGVASDWTTETEDLHFHDHGFDDYGTEVITLAAEYEHRSDIKALDWETTHRKWTGDAWRVDFAALDTAVEHFVDRGYRVTIDAGELTLFLTDYDGPFLKGHVPDEMPPDCEESLAGGDGQPDLGEF